ncbi:MAG: zinc-ribbon domain-containing protein [Methanocalculaceae archaeon]|nr:zinc-ribbon domain-containing protein [Methanocalculaceae archaeon]
MPYCKACGAEILDTVEVCPTCGTCVKNQPTNGAKQMQSAGFVGVCNFIWPGLGYCFSVSILLGLLMMFVLTPSIALCSFILLTIPYWIYAIAVAVVSYQKCQQNNAEFLTNIINC